MMKLARFLLVLLLVIVLLQISEAGNKNKEKGEKEQKSKKNESTKKKGGKDKEQMSKNTNKGKPGVEADKKKGKAEMKTEGKKTNKKEKDKESKESKKMKKKEKKKMKNDSLSGLIPERIVDREYWLTDSVHRVWTEEDNPMNIPEITEISRQLGNLVAENKRYFSLESDYLFDALSKLFEMQEQYLDLGIPISYLYGDDPIDALNNILPVSVVLGAMVNTRGGQDIPPIMTPSCTLDKCSSSMYQWIIDDENTIDPADVTSFTQPGIIERLQEGFIATFTQLSQTFSKKDTQEILCSRSKSISTTKVALATELLHIEDDTRKFLKEPEKHGSDYIRLNLKKAFDMVRAKMLMDMIDGLCR